MVVVDGSCHLVHVLGVQMLHLGSPRLRQSHLYRISERLPTRPHLVHPNSEHVPLDGELPPLLGTSHAPAHHHHGKRIPTGSALAPHQG